MVKYRLEMLHEADMMKICYTATIAFLVAATIQTLYQPNLRIALLFMNSYIRTNSHPI